MGCRTSDNLSIRDTRATENLRMFLLPYSMLNWWTRHNCVVLHAGRWQSSRVLSDQREQKLEGFREHHGIFDTCSTRTHLYGYAKTFKTAPSTNDSVQHFQSPSPLETNFATVCLTSSAQPAHSHRTKDHILNCSLLLALSCRDCSGPSHYVTAFHALAVPML